MCHHTYTYIYIYIYVCMYMYKIPLTSSLPDFFFLKCRSPNLCPGPTEDTVYETYCRTFLCENLGSDKMSIADCFVAHWGVQILQLCYFTAQVIVTLQPLDCQSGTSTYSVAHRPSWEARNSSHFMKHEGLFPHSQEPPTCLCPEPDPLHAPIPFLEDPF
jgi:hypothetical protein